MKLYVESTLNIHLLCRRLLDFPELAIFASRSGAMINLHWLELPLARTIFHGPKGVRAIEVRLYDTYYYRKCAFGSGADSKGPDQTVRMPSLSANRIIKYSTIECINGNTKPG